MKQFGSFASFGAHLLTLAATNKLIEHVLLEGACVEIEKRAKQKIGEYQPSAGPFAAWSPLAESTKSGRADKGFPEDEPLLRTGKMRDSIHHKVIGNEGHVGSDSEIALYQELGTEKIPPRSFLGGSAFELGPKIARDIGIGFTAYLSGASTRIKVR